MMRTHAVALEDGGKYVVFLVETQVVPIVVIMDRKWRRRCGERTEHYKRL